MALDEIEHDRCPDHGGPFAECEDAEIDWFPQRSVCLPAAQAAVVNRLYDELHKDRTWHDGTETIWQAEFSRLTPWHYRDGVTLWLSKDDLSPNDDFLGQNPVG